MTAPNVKKTYQRFSVARRIEHWVLFVSFTLLAVTGLIQKFNQVGISLTLISTFGGIEAVRIIHRIAATIMMLEVIYHIIDLAYRLFVLRTEWSMLPGVGDLKDGLQAFGYNLGLSKTRPKMGRYTFDEKMEYWAMIWGTLIMGITGFMLWNPILTTKLLPGQFIPAAKVAHGMEAILAVLAILVWHLYHVHLRHLNMSIFTGKLSRHEMEDDHPLEMEKLDASEAMPAPDVIKGRLRVFIPVASVMTLLMLFFVYWVITAERTAIPTLPVEEKAPVLQIQTPTPVPGGSSLISPSQAVSWSAFLIDRPV